MSQHNPKNPSRSRNPNEPVKSGDHKNPNAQRPTNEYKTTKNEKWSPNQPKKSFDEKKW